MRKIQILSLFLTINSLVGWTQGYISITRDTSVHSKYHFIKGEIYPGGQITGQGNFILIGEDTVLIDALHSIPCGIIEDLTQTKLKYVNRVLHTQKIFVNLSDVTLQNDTSWLYDSNGQLLRYFTNNYSTALIDSAKIANGFRIVIPSTPVLYYSSEDMKALDKYYYGINQNDYLITSLTNDLQLAIPKGDNSSAYFASGLNRFGIVDPVQDSVILVGSGIYFKEGQWITNDPKLEFNRLIVILLIVILALGVVTWFLFIEKYPVYAVYDGTSFTGFAKAFGTTNKFIIKSNKAFHGVNMDNPAEKKDLKDSMAGEFLLVDRKYGFSLGRISGKNRKNVYCRKNNSQEDMASFCDKIKTRESNLRALNQKVFRRKKYNLITDYLIGYIHKNRTPHSLEELLASHDLSYGEPANQQKLPGINKLQQGQASQAVGDSMITRPIQSGTDAYQKNIAGHFDDIWQKISTRFSTVETKLDTLENRINILNDDFNQKNRGKPSVDMSFFKPEAQNISYCLKRLNTIEKDLVNYVGQLRSEEIELQYFLHSIMSRFLSKQMTIKEKQALWIPLIDGIISNSVLAHEDLVYKNLAEDISQFSNPLDKATYLNRQLFNDLWDSSLSNVLVLLEELRNTGSFLRQTVDGNVVSEIRGFTEQNIEAVLEIAKSLDLKIIYLPLFAQYENYNLKDLDIDIFTSFNYFYNNVRSTLEKNHIVQILSYGVTSTKSDRSTKTKIKIVS